MQTMASLSIQSILLLLLLLLAVTVSLSRTNEEGILLITPPGQHGNVTPLRHLRLGAVHTEAADAVFPIAVTGGCTADLVIDAVADACNCLSVPFLRALLGLDQDENDDDDNENDAMLYERLGQLCATAWGTVETSNWQHVDPAFTDQFMERFVQGETYLNGTFRTKKSL